MPFLKLGKVNREDVKKMKAKRKVKQLVKFLTYNMDKTSPWDVPSPNSGKHRESFMFHPKEHEEWVEYYSIRSQAAKALGQIGDQRAVEPLIQALRNDPNGCVRTYTAEALDNLGWQPDQGAAGVAYWVAKGEYDKCVNMGDIAVAPLIAGLEYAETSRFKIRKTLAKIGKPSVEPLITALEHYVNEYFTWIASLYQVDFALGTPKTSFMTDCIAGTKDVVIACVNSLGNIGDSRAVNLLAGIQDRVNQILSDELGLRKDWLHLEHVRDATIEALSKINQ